MAARRRTPSGGRDAERAQLRGWLRRHDVRPRKRWGQSFLVNPEIPQRLLEGWDLGRDTGVVEIGAGAGALTLPLLARGLRVVAVERDERLCALLEERIGEAALRLIAQDVLTWDPRPEMTGPSRWVLVGNLPYAITTPILEWSIGTADLFAWVSFMVQREYATRMLAAPCSRAYGSLTVWAGYHFRIETELAVGAADFWPMPKVDSVVLRLTPHPAPPVAVPSAGALQRVVRAAFAHRRKVLVGALTRGLQLPRDRVEAALAAASIDPRRRAETCSLEDFAALTRALGAAP